MLISKGMQAKITEQVGNELAASHQYLLIATYFDGEGLPSLAQHFYKQSLEERDHALRFIKYLVDADAPVRIPAIPAPEVHVQGRSRGRVARAPIRDQGHQADRRDRRPGAQGA